MAAKVLAGQAQLLGVKCDLDGFKVLAFPKPLSLFPQPPAALLNGPLQGWFFHVIQFNRTIPNHPTAVLRLPTDPGGQ